MKFDLHTHTSASDGQLQTEALLARAAAAGVEVVAVTDHDTTDGIERYKACAPKLNSGRLNNTQPRHTPARSVQTNDIQLIAGVEISTQWRGHAIHVVGLRIHPEATELEQGLAAQRKARIDRAVLISQKLKKLGLPCVLDAALASATHGMVGRPHFAAQLVAAGVVKDVKQAFRKYLGAGKPGDVKHLWVSLEQAIAWIHAAGGQAVLAHPGKYQLTRTRLRTLVGEFSAAGGDAIEVVSGKQNQQVTQALATLCQEAGLVASTGSDFHRPDESWADVGKQSTMPAGCKPVWDGW